LPVVLLGKLCVGIPVGCEAKALLQKVQVEKLLLLHRLNHPSTLVITCADALPMQLPYRTQRLGTIVVAGIAQLRLNCPCMVNCPMLRFMLQRCPAANKSWGSCEKRKGKGQRGPDPVETETVLWVMSFTQTSFSTVLTSCLYIAGCGALQGGVEAATTRCARCQVDTSVLPGV
jgi:hypothetical protein